MTAIVLAGGIGSRLQPVVSHVPKPMANINGIPFLAYLFRYMSINDVTKCILSVGYMSDSIIEHFSDYHDGISIEYAEESVPLGTGGAIKKALAMCLDEYCIVTNGDSFFDVNLSQMLKYHTKENAHITIALKEMNDFNRYGSVELTDSRISDFFEKRHTKKGFINGGVYCINRDIFEFCDTPDKFSFENFMTQKIKELKIMGMRIDGNFIDIGVPEDYTFAQINLPKWIQL